MSNNAREALKKNLQPGTEADQELVRSLLNQWVEAVNSFNAETVAGLYTTDAVLLATFEPVVLTAPAQRLDYFINFKARKKLKAEIDECHIQILDHDAGMANGIYSFHFLNNEEKLQTAKARYTFVFARQLNDEWRIVAHHSSVLPVPPSAS